jgi:hypothetical protein
MARQPQSVGNIATLRPLLKSVPSLARTAISETNTADVYGGTHLHSITGRLFITDKVSKLQFLIDTISNLCVYPVS